MFSLLIRSSFSFVIGLLFLSTLVQASSPRDICANQEETGTPYIACDSFTTDRLRYDRVQSAQQEIQTYYEVYQDHGDRNAWFTGLDHIELGSGAEKDEKTVAVLRKKFGDGPLFDTDHDLIQERDRQFFQNKEQSGIYRAPMSFADYLIYDRATSEFVGKFVFKDDEQDGRIERGLYILTQHRGKGLGVEIIAGIFKNVIDPAIGKPFVISVLEDINVPVVIKTKVYRNFQGVFGRMAPWYNYPSVSVSLKNDCGFSWKDHTPWTFYPIGKTSCMDQLDRVHFSEVIKEIYAFRKYMMDTCKIKEQSVWYLQDIFNIMNLLESQGSESELKTYASKVKVYITDNLYKLILTKDYDTFMSTVYALIFLGEKEKSLRGIRSPKELIDLLLKNDNPIPDKDRKLLKFLLKEKSDSDITDSYSDSE